MCSLLTSFTGKTRNVRNGIGCAQKMGKPLPCACAALRFPVSRNAFLNDLIMSSLDLDSFISINQTHGYLASRPRYDHERKPVHTLDETVQPSAANWYVTSFVAMS